MAHGLDPGPIPRSLHSRKIVERPQRRESTVPNNPQTVTLGLDPKALHFKQRVVSTVPLGQAQG
jgi:hypothetical protein